MPELYSIKPLAKHELKWWWPQSRRIIQELNALRAELSQTASPITQQRALWVLGTGTTTIFVARDSSGRIIGMSSYVVSAQLLGGKAWLEDVAVLQTWQGKGIGRRLVEAVINAAERDHITKLDLTSSFARAGAHDLYARLGWEKRDSLLMRRTPKKH